MRVSAYRIAPARGDLPRYSGQLGVQQGLHAVEGGFCLGLPDKNTFVRDQPPGCLLDGIKLGDPADGLIGDRGALRPVDVDELAPDMGHAGDLADGAGAIEVLEPGIAIGMHPTAVSGEVILRVFAYAVEREAISSHCPPLVRGQWRGWRPGAPRHPKGVHHGHRSKALRSGSCRFQEQAC